MPSNRFSTAIDIGSQSVASTTQSRPAVATQPTAIERIHNFISVLSAILAVVLIVVGILVLAGALISAWSLYKDPAAIEPFARYFVKLVPAIGTESSSLKGIGTLVAWLLAALMLLVIGKLASWAIGSGSRLVSPGNRHRE